MKKLMVVLVTMALFLQGCAAAEQTTSPAVSETVASATPLPVLTPELSPAPEPVTLIVQGSTSVVPIIEALAETYMQEHPHVTIKVDQTGNGAGVAACGSGEADIGMASRDLTDEERARYPELRMQRLCREGIAVVVNEANPVEGLTMDQIRAIFSGEVTNWAEVGGTDAGIIRYVQDSISGTREAFQQFLGFEIDDTLCAVSGFSGGQPTGLGNATIEVNGITNAGLGLALVFEGVKALSIDGIAPTEENLLSGEYWLYRDFFLLTSGEPEGETAAFIDYCASDPKAIQYMREKGYFLLN
jgi:phosphate transport system substrate-binding protein